jgi:MFS family permease
MKHTLKSLVPVAALVFLCMFNLTFIVPSVKELIIDRFDASQTDASLFVTVEMLAYIIFGTIWGALSDKAGERRIFIVLGLLGSSILYYAMSLAPDLMTILFLRFLQGAATVMAYSLLMTIALDISKRDEVGGSMGVVGMSLVLGLAFGAPVGGALGNLDPLYPLYAASAFFLAATATAFLFIRDTPIVHKPESIIAGITAMVRDTRILAPYLLSFAERFSAGFVVLLLPLFAADSFGSDPGQRGLLLTAFLIPFALLQYPFGRLSDKVGRRILLVPCGIAYATLFAFMGSLDLAGTAAILASCGIFAAVLLPASLALLSDLAPKGERATYMGGFNAVGSTGFAIGPLVAAALSGSVGYAWSFAVGGAIILCTILAAVPFMTSSRKGQ